MSSNHTPDRVWLTFRDILQQLHPCWTCHNLSNMENSKKTLLPKLLPPDSASTVAWGVGTRMQWRIPVLHELLSSVPTYHSKPRLDWKHGSDVRKMEIELRQRDDPWRKCWNFAQLSFLDTTPTHFTLKWHFRELAYILSHKSNLEKVLLMSSYSQFGKSFKTPNS